MDPMRASHAGAGRRIAAGLATAALVAGALVGGGAQSAAAATTSSFVYDCGSDSFTLTVQDPDASGMNFTAYDFGFGKAGVVEEFGSGGVGSPKPSVWHDNLDSVGLSAFSLATGDTVQVWYVENPSESSVEALKVEGRVLTTFTYCGLSSTARKGVLTNGQQHTYSYKGWSGKVSYDCKLNGIYAARTGSTAAATSMQEIFVHEGGAGAVPATFASFRSSSPQFTTLMPKLATGERIDIYAIPYAWLSPPQGWPTYPDETLATKAKTSKDAALVYSFTYGACTVPPTDQCATKPGVQTKPCPPLYLATVRWPKSARPGATYQVQICQAGKGCSSWHSTGKKRTATFKDLELGPHVVKIRSVTRAGVSKPLKVKFTVTTKFRRSP